jgi:hypothetical protein
MPSSLPCYLLVCRLLSDLAPYLSAQRQPLLVEVVADTCTPISLRLSDRSSVQLGYSLDVQQALQKLAAAQQQWQQAWQGQGQQQQQWHADWPNQQQQQQCDGAAWTGEAAQGVQGVVVKQEEQEEDAAAAGMKRTYSTTTTASGSCPAAAEADTSGQLEVSPAPAAKRQRGLFGWLASAYSGGKASSATQQQQLGTPEPMRAVDSAAAAALPSAAPPKAAAMRVPHASRQAVFSGAALAALFGSDQRMGVPGSLHRISAMRDRQGAIYGLTYR